MQDTGRIGNIQDIFEKQGLLMVVKYALPDVLGFLLAERGVAQTEKDLRDIGEIIAERMLLVWNPSASDPIKLLKEIKKKFFKKSKQIKGKILEKFYRGPKKILIIDKDCPVCPQGHGEEVQISGVHYCTAISGFVEALLKHLIQEGRTPYADVSCKTVASVGSGAKQCEMLIELEY